MMATATARRPPPLSAAQLREQVIALAVAIADRATEEHDRARLAERYRKTRASLARRTRRAAR